MFYYDDIKKALEEHCSGMCCDNEEEREKIAEIVSSEILKDSSVDLDNQGQYVIYTGIYENSGR